MPLKYALLDNRLTEDPNDYAAKVQDLESKSIDDIIDVMIGRGSTVTRAEALSVLEEYSAALEQLLRDGHSINTPLFNLIPSIKGVFYDKNESFNPERHQVRVNVRPGTRLRQIESQIQVERVSASRPTPEPEDFEDVASETRNSQITPGGLAKLTGSRLKYEPNDAQQGVFFIDAAGAETRVTMIARNKPSELNFQIPATLAAGAYTVEVRVVLPRTTDLRTGQLPQALQVL